MPLSIFDDSEQDAINESIRDVYPRFGSPGVIALHPHLKPKQVNQRAYKLGIKVEPGRVPLIFKAQRWRQPLPPDIGTLRQPCAEVYPDKVDQIAYTKAWK